MDLKESLGLIKEFLSPIDNKALEQSLLGNILNDFKQNQPEVCASLDNSGDEDVLWQFCLTSLRLLKFVNESRVEQSRFNCYFSLTDERLLVTCTQFVVFFGIHYNLEDNVGVSVDKLSKYGANIVKLRDKVSNSERNARLLVCLDQLLEMHTTKRLHVDFLRDYFYKKYLHNLICALIQVCYSPNSALSSSKNDDTRRCIYVKWLEHDLFEEVEGGQLVSSFLMIQGSSSPKRNPPQQLKQQQPLQQVHPWLLQQLGRCLTRCLLRPNSVSNVIKAVLGQMDALNELVVLESDWKKCDLVARILAQCPQEVTIDAYFRLIAPQLVELFTNENPRYARHFYRVAGSLYSTFAHRWPELTRTHITSELVRTFANDAGFKLLVENVDEFRAQLARLQLIFVSSVEPSWSTLSQLPAGVLQLLFDVLAMTRRHRTSKPIARELAQMSQDILKTYLAMKPATDSDSDGVRALLELLRAAIIKRADDRPHLALVASSVDLTITFTIVEAHANAAADTPTTTIHTVNHYCHALLDLVNALGDTKLGVNLMLHLLAQIHSLMMSNTDISNQKQEASTKSSSSSKLLIDIEQRMEGVELSTNTSIVYFTLLAMLFDKIEPGLIIQEHVRVIDVCKRLLLSIIACLHNDPLLFNCHDNEDVDNNKADDTSASYQTMQLIFSIIAVFTNELVELNSAVKRELQSLLSPLQQLKDAHADSLPGELIALAESLYLSIGTYCGGIRTAAAGGKAATRVLIEEINGSDNDDADDAQIDEFDRAMRDASDPLIPVRAHGLVALRRLVESKPPCGGKCVSKREMVVNTFLKALRCDDSYVYLAAINGLIALVDVEPRPHLLLDTLVDHYKDSDKRLDTDSKLKMGETLTRTVRNFGELVPCYGNRLLDAFLSGCKDSNKMVRSSALSNLAETCRLLDFSLGNHIHEILNCVASMLAEQQPLQQTDGEATFARQQQQRSASLVLKMIVEGLQAKSFLHVLGDAILPLYRLVSKTRATTNDDIVRLHCQQTIEHFNAIVKMSMFPTTKLEKNIQIL